MVMRTKKVNRDQMNISGYMLGIFFMEREEDNYVRFMVGNL